LTSPYQGSKIARYQLPLAIIIPIAAGALSLYGQRSECIRLVMEQPCFPCNGGSSGAAHLAKCGIDQ
jgi:hypothetical protein